ncbi:bifunctional UDP-N-acetylglucosamine diphosphorylase/glucosamine-1-phosphate N-acetyltransferase GlmU [Oricola cellulosilytica]|uniref:Bifunctional protein GlmU n=1 Tax=Oricola cellulosilytica TaxID=1429082 RepID=A0A4R0PB39_9HYPH|nr:bifunctional UDP-N-acetylglucosamine diphosphorylase/glucosamine-1-phosphate N-acetyltransferase GlmU [Oricola cellulosilytica]TCD13188.1 bifunctional UDP-N-acetylglucosamine diphosphorylase/glucosamine-1-phosphate N-acetyltransferase GlmU [Oricola cellulosilytica]
MARSCLTIILAAGQGTRMKSPLPKVLHPLAGKALVQHVADAAISAGTTKIAMVVGHGADEVREALNGQFDQMNYFVQDRQLGTGHAVLAARSAIAEGYDDVVVLFGDTPLVRPIVLEAARRRLADGADVVVVGFRPEDPTGYGRLIEKDGRLRAIREEKDASHEERLITFCNGGIMAFSGTRVLSLLDAIGNDNAKGEFYMTDAVEIAGGRDLKVMAIEASVEDVMGINTRVELAAAEAAWQRRRREELLLEGVSMTAPETVFLHHDTQISADVTVEPNVVFGPDVEVRTGARIRSFSHLEGALVGEGAEVGPFARLRPGASLGARSKVGNFCEVKKADVGAGAKINHLSYIGDAVIGAGANIGAGTITCNYDGFGKHLTEIGENAFVGSNSALVAPVSVGAGAYIASGSVITASVPADGVAFGRARQENKEGRAPELRARFAAAKEGKS